MRFLSGKAIVIRDYRK